MAKYELDHRAFWTAVSTFWDWDYQYTGKYRHPAPYADAATGAPAELNELIVTSGGPGQHYFQQKTFNTMDWGEPPPENQGRHFTNCCTFVASAVLLATYRLPPERRKDFVWTEDMHHVGLRWDPNDPRMPPHAYVLAKVADPVDWRAASFTPKPRTVYVCQKEGHTFFLADHDQGKVLFLEAAGYTNRTDLQAGRPNYWGGVGFKGIGPVQRGAKGPPTGWQAKSPTWADVKAVLVDMAELNIRPAYTYAVHLPYDPPESASPFSHYYHLNEARGEGGYFPLGLSHNLHAGVHLPLDAQALDADADGRRSAQEDAEVGTTAGADAPQPVRALGPGELVAARLGQGPINDRALAVAANGNGFVLVRHRLELEGRAQPITVYALYMHLVPVGHPGALHDRVPWFTRLTSHANGAVVNLDLVTGFGDRSFTTEEGAFGPSPASGRVTTLRCEPEGDVKDARAALTTDGKVATFAHPLLTVESGELLGHVVAVPAEQRAGREPGFLHWEVLAPVAGADSDLSTLMKFAEEKLGLGADYFKRVDDQSADNVVQAADLQNLAPGLLAEDNGGSPASALQEGYTPDDLIALMGKPEPLAFSKPLQGARATELTYLLKLEVESYQVGSVCTVAAGTPLALELETDDGRPVEVVEPLKVGPQLATTTVRVPAGARALRLKQQPEKFRVDLRERFSDPDRKTKEVDHLRRFVEARWRRLVVRHPNEWSVEALGRSLAARDASEPEAREGAEALAWWGRALEKPMLGPDGKPAPLFVAGGAPERLPDGADARLDAAHPVTFAWVVDLLVSRGHARLLPAQASTPTAADAAWIGWLPADQPPVARAVGEVTCAVAVAKGRATTPDGAPAPVTFRASAGGETVELGSAAWKDGVARVDLPFPLWGAWQLQVAVTGSSAAPRPIGSATLEARRPEPASPEVPKPAAKPKSAKLTFRVPFARHCPARLKGWVFVETRTATTSWTAADIGVPIDLTREPEPAPGKNAARIERRDGFIVSVTPPTGGLGKFRYKDYCDAGGGGTCRVAEALVDAVKKIRGEGPEPKLNVSNLAPSGLSVELGWPNLAPGKLKQRADAAGLPAGVTTTALETTLLVTVPAPPPDEGAGTATGEFTLPQAELDALLARRAHGGEELLVRFGCVFSNGRGPAHESEVETIDVAALSADGVVVRADEESLKLLKPGFASFAWGVSNITQANPHGALWASAKVVGNSARFWWRAKPRFEVGGERKGTFDGKTVSVSVPLTPGGSLTLTPVCTGTDLAGNPHGIDPGQPFTYDTTPAIEDLDAPRERVEADKVWITARLQAWPMNRELKVEVLGDDQQPLLEARDVHFTQTKVKSRADAQGNLSFWLPRAKLARPFHVRLSSAGVEPVTRGPFSHPLPGSSESNVAGSAP